MCEGREAVPKLVKEHTQAPCISPIQYIYIHTYILTTPQTKYRDVYKKKLFNLSSFVMEKNSS